MQANSQIYRHETSTNSSVSAHNPLALVPVPQEKKSLAVKDDVHLLSDFIKGESRATLGSKLQIVPSSNFNLVHLKTYKNELIASIKSSFKIKSTWVNLKSPYSKTLHKMLLKENFVPHRLEGEDKSVLEYHQYLVPQGYEIFFTEASFLWKVCWPKSRNSIYKFQLDTLIFTNRSYNNSWSPMTKIGIDQGKIYVDTLVNKMALKPTDRVTWLHKGKVSISDNNN